MSKKELRELIKALKSERDMYKRILEKSGVKLMWLPDGLRWWREDITISYTDPTEYPKEGEESINE